MESNDDTKRDLSTILNTQGCDEEEDEGVRIIRELHATYEIDENTKLKIDENDSLPDDLAIEANKSVQVGTGKRRVSIAEKVTIYETSVADTNTQSSGSVVVPTGARKDLKKIMLLIFLYTLQGIPMGEISRKFWLKDKLLKKNIRFVIYKGWLIVYRTFYPLAAFPMPIRAPSVLHSIPTQ